MISYQNKIVTRPLSLKEYCPKMIPRRTWEDIKRARLNAEAEAMSTFDYMPEVDNKKLLQDIKAQRVRRFKPGIYNFIKYNVEKYLP